MRATVWGARGSVPAPGPATMRYGGNTSCVQLELSDGSTLVLDAGTGIRALGLAMPENASPPAPLHILLTHLHLDHIQGLLFFAPMFRPDAEIVIWGPSAPEASLRDRIARYISAPLMPVEIRELPCAVSFNECEGTEWQIGPARVRAESVSHRGPTLGYRVEDAGASVCYIPDHEPGLGAKLDDLPDDWISGFSLARGADLLIHDGQYTDEEYPAHMGWGHSPMRDTLTFARRAGVRRLLAFHHDPLHTDRDLDDFCREATARWVAMGHAPTTFDLAAEGMKIDLSAQAAAA